MIATQSIFNKDSFTTSLPSLFSNLPGRKMGALTVVAAAINMVWMGKICIRKVWKRVCIPYAHFHLVTLIENGTSTSVYRDGNKGQLKRSQIAFFLFLTPLKPFHLASFMCTIWIYIKENIFLLLLDLEVNYPIRSLMKCLF